MGGAPTRAPTAAGVAARLDRWLVRLNAGLLVGLLGAMACLVFANVVARYFFGVSFEWVEETTRYMMIWLAYLGAGLALRNGSHVAVTLAVDMLPPVLRRVVRTAAFLIVVAFMAAVAWYGWRYAVFAWNRTTPILGLSFGMLYLAIPAGAALVVVHALADWRAQTAAEPSVGRIAADAEADGAAPAPAREAAG
jgi:TRAP-type C4-dicarboxylate transport system permease small subunit